jgi:mono/diheme cytochrome c family protein
MIEKYVDAEELKRLVSTLTIVLGAIVIAALFASFVVPGLRNANKPEAPMPVNPVVGEPGWLDPTAFPPERGKVIPPVDAAVLVVSSPALVEKGKDLFEKNCVQCHGESGRGDGPAAVTMNPRPRNLAGANGWTNGYDLPAIFRTLSLGVSGTSMAAFDYLAKKDRMALAHYVQSLGAFPHDTAGQEAMQSLSRELAAPGEKTPNKIPVNMAMARLQEEFSASAPLVSSPEDRSPGAELLRRFIADPSRAAQTLAGSQAWREGPKELAASVLPAIPGNGFSPGVATLSAGEWQSLHEELIKMLPPKPPGAQR